MANFYEERIDPLRNEDQGEEHSLHSRHAIQEHSQQRIDDLERRCDLYRELSQTRKVRKLERMKCDMCRADKQKVRVS
jgi:hypothetical protein